MNEKAIEFTRDQLDLLELMFRQRPTSVSRDFREEELVDALLAKISSAKNQLQKEQDAINAVTGPDWGNCHKCHDWKNYVQNDYVDGWEDLSLETRLAIYHHCEEQARKEEWD